MLTEAIVAAIGAAAGAVITGIGAAAVQIIKAKKTKTEDKELEFNHTENLVKLASGQSQEIEEIKNIVSGVKESVIELTESQASFNRMYLRHSILRVYFSYEQEKEIPIAEWESVLGLYDVYTSLNGNGFIHEKIDEMRNWKKV